MLFPYQSYSSEKDWTLQEIIQRCEDGSVKVNVSRCEKAISITVVKLLGAKSGNGNLTEASIMQFLQQTTRFYVLSKETHHFRLKVTGFAQSTCIFWFDNRILFDYSTTLSSLGVLFNW